MIEVRGQLNRVDHEVNSISSVTKSVLRLFRPIWGCVRMCGASPWRKVRSGALCKLGEAIQESRTRMTFTYANRMVAFRLAQFLRFGCTHYTSSRPFCYAATVRPVLGFLASNVVLFIIKIFLKKLQLSLSCPAWRINKLTVRKDGLCDLCEKVTITKANQLRLLIWQINKRQIKFPSQQMQIAITPTVNCRLQIST